jgi:hypothetical protein
LIKHSRSNIASVIKELSKGMNRATTDAYKEMLRVTKFSIYTESFCLKIELKADEKIEILLLMETVIGLKICRIKSVSVDIYSAYWVCIFA